MSRSKVESKALADGDGRGKEISATLPRGGRDVWELEWDVGGMRSGLTNATRLRCMSESTSSALECFMNQPKNSKKRRQQLTISKLRSFPATLIAALSTSTSARDDTRKSPSAVRAEAARPNAPCGVAADFFTVGSTAGAFHPDFITAESPCEAPFTARIAEIRFSWGDLGVSEYPVAAPLRAPFAFEMVVDASLLVISSVETTAAFPPTTAFCVGAVRGRVAFALVAMLK